MEKLTDYTSNPEYMNDWNKLMAQQHDFTRDVLENGYVATFKIEGLGVVPIAGLRGFCARNLVNKEMEEEIVQELVGRHDGAIERMLEESPAVAAKREKLNVSIKLLRESNNVLGNIMDKIASNI
ncbi:hypothetical protein H0E87_007449 [Populus deltoides]|uniref:GED domain-containing protein n=1 Tax=Populus deltoides TaxID=3696 RepID=A0A8T2ZBA8_POPDE|nr:hypothetical protein H0E87_007449 [Populus deltoides]